MEVPEKENQEVKRRFQLWVMPSTLELADQYYRSDNCASRSEFIEKAIQFYAGYVSSQQNQDYLARVIPATVKGIVDESSNRMGRLLFKMAVELAVIENILAAVCEVDRQELKRLRGQCVEEIKRSGRKSKQAWPCLSRNSATSKTTKPAPVAATPSTSPHGRGRNALE